MAADISIQGRWKGVNPGHQQGLVDPLVAWRGDDVLGRFVDPRCSQIFADRKRVGQMLVVIRVPHDQGGLLEGLYRHTAIITNIEDQTPAQIVRFHRGRGDAENRFKELEGGFSMDTMPCRDLFAKAAYFQTLLLAYNLIQVLKYDALPDAWRPKTIKTLRLWLFSIQGRVVRHARRWVLKLSRRSPFLDLLAHAFCEGRHITT